MARQLRLEFAGALYHVYNRGVEKRRIFLDSRDYGFFLKLCEGLKLRHQARLHAYCLMPNHFHLCIRTGSPGLHRFMHELAGEYARYFNWRHSRVGHLFQGRYRALLVQEESYVLDVVRYIHLNPVKGGLSALPEGYRWSSYREYLGEDARRLVETRPIIARFDAENGPGGVALFKAFTQAGKDSSFDPLANAKAKTVLGGGEFLGWLKRVKIPRSRAEGIAGWGKLQRPGDALGESIRNRVERLTTDRKLRRKLLVYALHYSTPLPEKDIARLVGMKTVSAVSQTLRRLNEARKDDRVLGRMIGELERYCRAGQRTNP
jgi:putative transposase